MKNLAVIPARSGSKGLRDKNIKQLAGKPLMAHTIGATLEAGIFDTVMVSTDSEAYAEIAREFGAEVPFLRSVKHSSDAASSWDAVREVLRSYANLGMSYETVALLQPTSPLRVSADIATAYRLFEGKRADAVVSVTEVDYPVQLCFTLSKDGSMHDFGQSEYRNMRRQQLAPYYRENGAIYIVQARKLLESSKDIYQWNCYAYEMPKERSIDIDGMIDFKFAELLLAKN